MLRYQRPHPRFSDRRSIHLEDTADDNAIGKHVVVVIVPFARLATDLLRVEDMQGRALGTATLQPGDGIDGAARKILRENHGRHGAFYDPISYRGRGVV